MTTRFVRAAAGLCATAALVIAAAVATTPSAAAAGVGPGLDLGSGFVVAPSPASAWVAANPDDPRAPQIAERIASEPSGLWLTGPESYRNLDDAVRRARDADGTLTLVLYAIPGRDNGIDPPTDSTLAQYRSFVGRVATTLGPTRAAVVVEPDALWFVDRQTPPGTAAYRERMAALNSVADAFARFAPGSRLYLDAGTSSGSVTPARMADLLVSAGVQRMGGFATNVSSYAPAGEIERYARAVRGSLRSRYGIADPRFVVDTGRNGASDWDGTWCNPTGRTLGVPPALYADPGGLDATLWVKQPGTSDGDCGNGPGSTGGQFLPGVAFALSRRSVSHA